jgi:putative membrane protein
MLILVPVLILIIVSVLKNSSASDADGIMPDVDVLFMFFLFFVGILAAAALVIPGISGSFIFLLFGVYPLITSTLSSVRVLPGDIANARLWLDVIKVLGPLATGIIIGGLCAARLIVKLLDNYYKITYSIILGLLAGSVYTLLNDPIVFYSGASLPVVILGAQMLFIGAVISFVLGKKRF